MRIAHYRALELRIEKAVPFQTAWRGFAARRALLLLQEEKDREWHAAVLLQRAWYRRVTSLSRRNSVDKVIGRLWVDSRLPLTGSLSPEVDGFEGPSAHEAR